jgi:site-specific DNA-methyltransferase (adenine-specific)/adenine-specific DNA-methyltransferase
LKDIDGIVPWTWWPHEEVGHTDEAKKEIQSIFGTQTAFPTPKPVRLIERILQIATKPGDLILDSFAGSGTTAHAVMKLNAEDGGARKFILVEMDPAIVRPVTAERVRRVARGYTNAKGEAVPGLGSDFRYCTLGEALFDGEGQINGELSFQALARHLYFTEFGEPLPQAPAEGETFIGAFGDRALHLLFKPGQVSLLDRAALKALPSFHGERVVFADGCSVPESALTQAGVRFRQVPYDVRG